MLTPRDVTACLVTRGDQPEMMERILDSLIFPSVIVWDNSVEPDWKCAGRYMAALRSPLDHVYFQDDDVIVPEETQRALLDEYEGPIVANWGHGENHDGYDDLPLVGGGAIASKRAAWDAIAWYGAHFNLDQSFQYEADFVVGVLYPQFKHIHLPFEINMEVAQHSSRLVNQPWQKNMKLAATTRARWVRDAT